jgi:hypothetical protein
VILRRFPAAGPLVMTMLIPTYEPSTVEPPDRTGKRSVDAPPAVPMSSTLVSAKSYPGEAHSKVLGCTPTLELRLTHGDGKSR